MNKGAARDIVLVTGASGGIGAALATEFAAAGHDVFLVARRETQLAQRAQTLKTKYGVRVNFLALDLTENDAGAQLETEIARRNLIVDILVNNAGFGLAGRADRIDRNTQLEMLDLNIRALVDLTLRFLPRMRKRRRGGVFNVGSIAGFQPGPYMAGYYASKAFVASFTAALAAECRGSGVRVINLAPGPVATGFAARAGMERARLFQKMQVQDAEAVARAGYRGFTAGRPLVIPKLTNRLFVLAGQMIPGRLRDWVVSYIVKPR